MLMVKYVDILCQDEENVEITLNQADIINMIYKQNLYPFLELIYFNKHEKSMIIHKRNIIVYLLICQIDRFNYVK